MVEKSGTGEEQPQGYDMNEGRAMGAYAWTPRGSRALRKWVERNEQDSRRLPVKRPVPGEWGWLILISIAVAWTVAAQFKKVEFLSHTARRHRALDALLVFAWAWHTLKGQRDG